jgi:tetratricopeptide (TPR) repeat protein
MTTQLAEALRLAGPELPGARARASMVAAVSLHFAGRFDLALPWYHRTRDDAAIEGDDATISAVMHNMSGLRISNARLQALFGGDPGDEIRQALLGAESTGHFDLGVGTASLLSLVPMLRAQAHLLQGDVTQALALYREHLEAALADGLAWQEGSFRADMAWCLATQGQVDEARGCVQAAARALERGDADADDRACAHARLAATLARLGDSAAAEAHHRRAREALAEHRRLQAEVMALHDRDIRPLLAA